MEHEFFNIKDIDTEVLRSTGKQNETLTNGVKIGVFLAALSIAIYTLPDDIAKYAWFSATKIVAVSFSFEIVRAFILFANITLARIYYSGREIIIPIFVLGSSLGIAIAAGIGLHKEHSGADDQMLYITIQGCNAALFIAELTLTFLLAKKSLRYEKIAEQLAEISDRLATISDPIAAISDFLNLKKGISHHPSEVLRKALNKLKACDRDGEIHKTNLALISGKIISIKDSKEGSAVRVLVCPKGSLNPLPSNATKSIVCNCCNTTLYKD